MVTLTLTLTLTLTVWGHGEQKHMVPRADIHLSTSPSSPSPARQPSLQVPRPDIHLQQIDPAYDYTYAHFDDLYVRYGGPVFILDLVRQVEKRPRETLLGHGLSDALAFLAQAKVAGREQLPQLRAAIHQITEPFADRRAPTHSKGTL